MVRHADRDGAAGCDRRLGCHQLCHVAHPSRERGRSLGPLRIVAQEVGVVLHRRAATRRVHGHHVAALECLDGQPRERAGWAVVPSVELERTAAARLGRRHHLVTVGRQDPRGRRVHAAEEHSLYAALEQPDPCAPLAAGGGHGWRRRLGRASRGQLQHRAEAGEPSEQPAAPPARGSRQAESVPGRDQRGERTHPVRVREGGEDRAAHQPLPGRPVEVPLDLRPGVLDQLVVPDPRGARRDARHAPEALVDVRDQRARKVASLLEPGVHQDDPAPRRVHLLVPERVGGARR